MKRILIRKSYREWECINPWVKIALDTICEKNKIPKTKYGYTKDTIEFRTCNEIIELLYREDQLGEFEICEIPDEYTDIAIQEFDDYEYLIYVKDGKMYDKNNELVSGERG